MFVLAIVLPMLVQIFELHLYDTHLPIFFFNVSSIIVVKMGLRAKIIMMPHGHKTHTARTTDVAQQSLGIIERIAVRPPHVHIQHYHIDKRVVLWWGWERATSALGSAGRPTKQCVIWRIRTYAPGLRALESGR